MSTHPLHSQHERLFEENRFVYPVLSRRSGGISLGVNLNPDKVCNFDCLYCQVDRTEQSETRFVELEPLLLELSVALEFVLSGSIFQTEKFRETPRELRRLNDIAFSGDGEPTTYQNFDEILVACAKVLDEQTLGKLETAPEVKMVLITNASRLHRPHVRRGLEILDSHHGEIWTKLDAGSEEYFHLVDRTPIRFQRILENIADAARVRPLVIQSLFMRVHGEPPSPEEQDAFCDRLNEIVASGGALKLVQIYTIARQPAESYVSPLSDEEVEAISQRVVEQTGLNVRSFYGGVAG